MFNLRGISGQCGIEYILLDVNFFLWFPIFLGKFLDIFYTLWTIVYEII
jgi:hypothetical protein